MSFQTTEMSSFLTELFSYKGTYMPWAIKTDLKTGALLSVIG